MVHFLARAWAGCPPEAGALTAKAAETLGRAWPWIPALAQRYAARFEAGTRPRQAEVVRFLADDKRFIAALRKHRSELHVERHIAGPASMQPVAAMAAWGVPAIETEAALAEWLRLTPGELEWFADLKGLARRGGVDEKLRHYHVSMLAKRTGGVRVIESPKPRMKVVQRRVLSAILDRIEVHPAVHGFVRGRSIGSFAALHAGRAVVLRMDLCDFFPSVRRARVQALFRTMGYPERVADLLGGLTTTRTPTAAFRDAPPEHRAALRERYGPTHLPQGAPTSPALANACCYRLDCRLAGLAEAAGAVYTRYADDLAFSGGTGFARGAERFAAHVGAIVLEEGHAVNCRKTRAMRQGVRQQLAGLVVNERLNVRRDVYDQLKAILTNCIRNGPRAENRVGHPAFREHLEGRVAFVASVNASRGAKLRELLARIQFE